MGNTMADENTDAGATATDEAPDLAGQLEAATKEAEKWKALSRKNEEKAKSTNSQLKEFEEWKKSQLSDTERALEEAKASARAEVVAEYSGKLARTAFLSAAAGRLDNAEKVLGRLDVNQFLTESGDVDSEAIGEFLDSIAPVAEPTPEQPVGLFQGSRSEAGALPLNGDPLLNRVNALLGIQS